MFLRACTLIRSETMPKAGSATMYTSGCPKNQNRCWNSNGLPPRYASGCPIDTSAGMKKLVCSVLSSNIITAETNSAGNASNASTVAITMPHTVSGMRSNVMPSVRACKTVVT